jgi:RIO kinase 1
LNTQLLDTYDDFDFVDAGREARRQQVKGYKKRKQGGNGRVPQPTSQTLTDVDDRVESWVPSYAKPLDPKHHERYWLIESVSPFYRDNIITDVTRLVKGGKEANVYACTAHPAMKTEMIAAKLYRPRMLRNLKNDAIYKAGRQLRDAEGKQLKGRREKLAIRKKTDFGKEVDIQWWIGNEYMTQTALYEAGADVPQPIAHQGNTILMAFIGDEFGAAPTLSEIKLPADEAQPLFRRTMENIALMLDLHLIHGDLSAYNILYWDGRITLIDFPQMVDARKNPHAFDLLLRDVTRVCDYFGRYGMHTDPRQLTLDLWRPYMREG